MKRILFLALTLFVSVGAFAQTELPANFFFTGVARDNSGTSANSTGGVFSIATRLDAVTVLPTYSLSTSDIGFVKNSSGKYVATSTMRTGFATIVYHNGSFIAFLLGDGGAAIAGQNTGFAVSAGGGIGYNLGPKGKNVELIVVARNTKSSVGQTQYGKVEFGIGKSF